MSQTETVAPPSVSAMAAGLVTAAADVAPISKVLAAVNHGAETFINHNPMLTVPLVDAEKVLGSLADAHGLGTVWAFLSELFPFLAAVGPHPVIVPEPAPPPEPEPEPEPEPVSAPATETATE